MNWIYRIRLRWALRRLRLNMVFKAVERHMEMMTRLRPPQADYAVATRLRMETTPWQGEISGH